MSVCKALSGTSIQSLSMDRNLKIGMFSSGKEAGEALAKFVNSTPMLTELTVRPSLDPLVFRGC